MVEQAIISFRQKIIHHLKVFFYTQHHQLLTGFLSGESPEKILGKIAWESIWYGQHFTILFPETHQQSIFRFSLILHDFFTAVHEKKAWYEVKFSCHS